MSCVDNDFRTRGLALSFGNGVALSFVENRDSLFLSTNRSVTHGSMGAWWIMVNYDQAYVNNATPQNICLKPTERRMKWSLCKKQILKIEFQEISLTAWKRLKAQLFNSQVVPSWPFYSEDNENQVELKLCTFSSGDSNHGNNVYLAQTPFSFLANDDFVAITTGANDVETLSADKEWKSTGFTTL